MVQDDQCWASASYGSAYISLSSTFSGEPDAMLLWVDDNEAMTGMDLRELFDNWTALAMNGE